LEAGGSRRSFFCLESKGPLRFNELGRCISDGTQRVLTNQLRELERAGLVKGEHFSEIPARVEYSLTQVEASLGPVAQVIDPWG